jgi:hypothetical protein
MGASCMVRFREDYKGEGGGFPQVRAIVNPVSSCLPMFRPCIKSVLIMHKPTCCLVCVDPCE